MSFNLIWWIFPALIFLVKENDNIKSIFLLLFLIIILGMRPFEGVANDTENYMTIFSYGIEFIKEHLADEPLSAYINILFISLNASFQWVLLTFAVISVTSVYIACRVANINAFKGLILYVLLSYYFYTFNCMRQMTADAVLLIGYAILTTNNYTKFKKVIIYCLVVALSAQIHKSAYAALLIAPIHYYNINLSYRTFCIIGIGTLLVGAHPIAKQMVDTLSNIMGTYAVPEKYGYIYAVSPSKIAMTLFYMYLYKKSNKNDILLKTVVLGLFLFNFMGFSVATMRSAYTFLICQVLYLSNIKLVPTYSNQKNKISQIAICYCVFIYYYFYYYNISDMHNYVMNPISSLFK